MGRLVTSAAAAVDAAADGANLVMVMVGNGGAGEVVAEWQRRPQCGPELWRRSWVTH